MMPCTVTDEFESLVNSLPPVREGSIYKKNLRNLPVPPNAKSRRVVLGAIASVMRT